MARMTDEEAAALDERWTKNPPNVGPNGTGFFAKRKAKHLISLDDLSADYLRTKAAAEHKTPTEIVSELIREKLVRETA
jgi:hypothetical protein